MAHTHTPTHTHRNTHTHKESRVCVCVSGTEAHQSHTQSTSSVHQFSFTLPDQGLLASVHQTHTYTHAGSPDQGLCLSITITPNALTTHTHTLHLSSEIKLHTGKLKDTYTHTYTHTHAHTHIHNHIQTHTRTENIEKDLPTRPKVIGAKIKFF